MSGTIATRRALGLALAAALLAGTAACAPSSQVPAGVAAIRLQAETAAQAETSAGTEVAAGGTTTGAVATATACDDGSDPLASYAPEGALPSPGAMPAGSTMAAIYESGSLTVGVSADTLLMGSRNPLSGEMEGFDVDIAHAVSAAIFGDPNRIQYRVITSGQRLDVLTNGDVDMVVRTFTINCDRWKEIAFSAEYFHSGQKVLVPLDSTATSVADLEGQRVCAPVGTTTFDRLSQWEGIEPVAAATHTGCLVLFQQGEVDAITGDDTVLAGFAAQDPYAKVIGEAISDEPYGVGIPADKDDMVRFVNGVLENLKADGSWTSSYNTWLGVLGTAPAPPTPVYGRTP